MVIFIMKDNVEIYKKKKIVKCKYLCVKCKLKNF